jgi:large subunit ribosomal protein L22
VEVKAVGKNISVAQKKLQPIVEAVRGKPVAEALRILQFLPNPVAQEIAKVVKSAASNAENNLKMNPDALRVVSITATEGLRLKRFDPMSRGRAGRKLKRHSHVVVVVDEREA